MSAPLEIRENTILVILGASGDLAKKKLASLIPQITTIVLILFSVSSTLRPCKVTSTL